MRTIPTPRVFLDILPDGSVRVCIGHDDWFTDYFSMSTYSPEEGKQQVRTFNKYWRVQANGMMDGSIPRDYIMGTLQKHGKVYSRRKLVSKVAVPFS